MSDSWRGSRFDLERELRRSRPQPPRDFIRGVSSELRGRRERQGSLRLAFVGGLTVVMLAAISSTGGIGMAATAVKAVVSTVSGDGMTVIHRSPAHDQYHCNSGRGNLSETDSGTRQTDSSTLVNPHTGGTGPGPFPTDDCDPGNSGPHNRGGD